MIASRSFRYIAKVASPLVFRNMIRPLSLRAMATPASIYQPFKFNFATEQEKRKALHIETSDDFEDKVLNSQKPVILDFYADWCGPCKRLTPLLEQKYNKSNGEWVFAKVNVDNFQDLAKAFNVSSIPAVVLIHKGEVVDHFIGLPPEQQLDTFVAKAAELGTAAAV